MTRKPETLRFWVGRLPHWEVEEGRYFITIHLAGAIPQQGRDRLRILAEQAWSPELRTSPDWLQVQRKIFREMEDWLDRSTWSAHLRHEAVADMVVEAIEHRKKRGDWQMFEYVIMPTHIHLFGEFGRQGMETTLQDFKRWTGHQATRLLGTSGTRFWQREWFDHWSRSDEEDERIIRYIRNNPVKAGLVMDYKDYRYGSWR